LAVFEDISDGGDMPFDTGDTKERSATVELDANPVGTSKHKLAAQIHALQQERDGSLPIWIRAPVQGPEYYSGLTRPKLYQLAAGGHIRSVSIREPGKIRGCRLFDLASILDFIARQANTTDCK
jgi:hypothetical protein